MSASNKAYNKLVNHVCELKQEVGENQNRHRKPVPKPTYDVGFGEEAKNYRQKFIDAISDDLQAPKAVAVLWEVVKSNLPPNEKLNLIFEIDEVLALTLKSRFYRRGNSEEIIKLAQEREEARLAKDFKKSDELRKNNQRKGYDIKDTDGGSKISKR